MQKNSRFLIDSLGIFVSYFYFGILQEKVTRGQYKYRISAEKNNDPGEQQEDVYYETEKFTYTLALVFFLCLSNYIVAKVKLQVWPEKNQDKTPQLYHSAVACTYLLGMVCSNMALQWIPYPTQVVGKAAKPIPVLILAVLLGRKSYPWKKYFFVTLIVIGVILFMFNTNKSGGVQQAGYLTFGLGELLLILSLVMDGLTGAIQERIRAGSKPTGFQMMVATNGWSCIFLIVALTLSGEGVSFLEFTKRHPYVIYNIILLTLTQAVGQTFLYSMVSNFGPLSVSIVTTTRKFFTVLGSVLIFGNTLTGVQWFGAVLVFTALFSDIFFSNKSKQSNIEHTKK